MNNLNGEMERSGEVGLKQFPECTENRKYFNTVS